MNVLNDGGSNANEAQDPQLRGPKMNGNAKRMLQMLATMVFTIKHEMQNDG